MARAKRKTNIRWMMRFIKEIIDGESDRLNFDLDFNYHLIRRYDKMYDEDPEAAEVFAERVGDQISFLHLIIQIYCLQYP